MPPPHAEGWSYGVQIAASDLTALVTRIVIAAGSHAEEARLVAENLVAANLAGHDSHGVGMIPRYIDALLAGELSVNQHVRVVADQGAILTLDGQRGFGQVIGRQAFALALPRARQHGLCLLALRNTHHLARIGQWAEDCAAAGIVSLHFVNVVIALPLVAPWGGTDARFGTNPMCVGIPRAGGEPLILDFASSRIALGKVRVAMNKGEALPPDTLIDHRGAPTTDPRAMFPEVSGEPIGAVLPFGEHKGSGIAMVCEQLGAALIGGEVQVGTRPGAAIINNMLSILIDPARLDLDNSFHREMERFIAWVKASPPNDAGQVLIAGDPERSCRARRTAEGIPIDATTWNALMTSARRVGVSC
jgi:uncharacterized oxidoreductase